jgi:aspartate/methionine/tyrosine aminotransferase
VVNYGLLNSLLKHPNIPYIPSNTGLYIFAKIAPHAKSWDDDTAAVAKLKEAGVVVSGGKGYHPPEFEMGWACIGIAVEQPRFDKALKRVASVLNVAASPCEI